MPVTAQDGNRGCQDKLGDEYLDYEHIHFLLNIAQLIAAKLRVHHNARFLTRVNDETDDPLGVFQLSSLQKHLLMRQWEKLIADVHLAIKGVEVSIRWLGHDLPRDQDIARMEINARWYELI